MVDFGMEPQAALDAPRFRLEGVDSAIGPASVRTSKYAPLPNRAKHSKCLLTKFLAPVGNAQLLRLARALCAQ